ncbi:MAG: TolC family protein [Calditrichia bacterium]
MKRVIRSSVFLIVFLVTIKPGFGQFSLLDSLLSKAHNQNPLIKGKALQFKAAEEMIRASGALPDPMLSFALNNVPTDSYDLDQEPMTGKMVAFSQSFPFPGKLGLKEEISRMGSVSAKWELENTRIGIDFRVKKLFFEIHFLDRAIEIVQKNQNLLQNFIDIAQTKYAVGKGIQQDVLKAQVEYSLFFDKIVTLKQMRESKVAQLDALLNLELNNTFPEINPLPEKLVDLDENSITQFAIKNNPVIKKIESLYEQNKFRTRLAKKNYLPDFTLGIAYTQREVLQTGMGGVDFVSGSVGLKIPLYFWKKQRNEYNSAKYREKSSQFLLEDILNQTKSQLNDAFQQVKKQKELLDLYKNSIIPQATQSLNSAISGYQTDKVDFLTLLNNLIVLFNYEKDYYQVLTNYYIQIARIEYLADTTLLSTNNEE